MNNFILHLYVGMDGVTEDQREQIRDLLTDDHSGYTEFSGMGGWGDEREASMKWETVLSVIDEAVARRFAEYAAGQARLIAKQQAVLWTLTPVISGMSEAQS